MNQALQSLAVVTLTLPQQRPLHARRSCCTRVSFVSVWLRGVPYIAACAVHNTTYILTTGCQLQGLLKLKSLQRRQSPKFPEYRRAIILNKNKSFHVPFPILSSYSYKLTFLIRSDSVQIINTTRSYGKQDSTDTHYKLIHCDTIQLH